MYYFIDMKIMLFLMIFVLSNCQNKADHYSEKTDYVVHERGSPLDKEIITLYENSNEFGIELLDELPPLIFPNIQELDKYIVQNKKINDVRYIEILNDLHTNFMNTNVYGLMGYNWYSGIILADLDKDNVYELYLNASTGSGFVHSFIHGYNPITRKYYILSKRMETNYILFIYKNILYVLSSSQFFSEENKTFKFKLLDNEIILEEIDENIQNEILELMEITNIFYPFDSNLTRYNTLR